jgi:HD superfamily phosphohydrolase
MEKKTIIQDTIYTYIEIESTVKNIIDTESFQRLKNIRQLTVQHLYPSANHTRFEHSLGVMHLALRVFERIKPVLYAVNPEQTLIDLGNEGEIHLRTHLLYAALLHDVGHAPLSHVGELHYDRDEIIGKIKKLLQEKAVYLSIGFLNDSKIAPHELMSCYVIIKKFKDKLETCFTDDKSGNLRLDLEFIFRIICGCYYNSKNDKRNVVISIVNSDTFDVDKLDYLLRDNKIVGYIGPQIDIERLIMSVTIGKNDRITFTHMGISAIQRVIDCRDNLYLWVYNHHTVVYTDYLYQECFICVKKLFSGNNGEDPEKTPGCDLFSCEAIADNCVSDAEALSAINRAARIIKSKESSFRYEKKLISQLLSRNYLKPLWKTLSQYNKFLQECDRTRKEDKTRLSKFIEKKENRKRLVKEILSELNMEDGDLFIISRENKFYEYNLKNCEIKHYGSFQNIKELLPLKNHDEKYEKATFYVFYDSNIKSKGEIEKVLKEKLKRDLPEEKIPDKEQDFGFV